MPHALAEGWFVILSIRRWTATNMCVPFTGQGMNAALGDTHNLCELRLSHSLCA